MASPWIRRLPNNPVDCDTLRNELIEAGHPVVYVDLWTASTPEDMTTRLTKAATATLGRRRTELVAQIGQRLRFNLEFGAGRLVSRRRD